MRKFWFILALITMGTIALGAAPSLANQANPTTRPAAKLLVKKHHKKGHHGKHHKKGGTTQPSA